MDLNSQHSVETLADMRATLTKISATLETLSTSYVNLQASNQELTKTTATFDTKIDEIKKQLEDDKKERHGELE